MDLRQLDMTQPIPFAKIARVGTIEAQRNRTHVIASIYNSFMRKNERRPFVASGTWNFTANLLRRHYWENLIRDGLDFQVHVGTIKAKRNRTHVIATKHTL